MQCRTPDSPESARAVAPKSPISPKAHHTSLVPPRSVRNGSSSPNVNGTFMLIILFKIFDFYFQYKYMQLRAYMLLGHMIKKFLHILFRFNYTTPSIVCINNTCNNTNIFTRPKSCTIEITQIFGRSHTICSGHKC